MKRKNALAAAMVLASASGIFAMATPTAYASSGGGSSYNGDLSPAEVSARINRDGVPVINFTVTENGRTIRKTIPTTVQAARAVAAAKSAIHLPYVWGGGSIHIGPSNGGFDCEGLVRYAFYLGYQVVLPPSSQAQRRTDQLTDVVAKDFGQPLSAQDRSRLRPGDVIAMSFPHAPNGAWGHSVLYVGDGYAISASGPDTGIEILRLSDFNAARWVVRRLSPTARRSVVPVTPVSAAGRYTGARMPSYMKNPSAKSGATPQLNSGTATNIAMGYFVGLGLTPIQAAGIVGNLIAESNLSPTAHNPSGATGIAQWMGGRLRGLHEFANNIRQPWNSFSTQLRFAASEMGLNRLDPPASAGSGAYADMIVRLQKARPQTTQQAADIADWFYEIYDTPGHQTPSLHQRELAAANAYAQYVGGTGK